MSRHELLTLARLEGKPEIFYSFQGEGRNQGRPSVFVRLANCNLHCIWCDTDYTWNWKGTRFVHKRDEEPGYRKYDRSQWTIDLPVDEVAVALEAFTCKNMVITGGEPLLQDEACVHLMSRLRRRDAGYHFELETNGTLRPSAIFDELIDQYNVSPKLANSNNPASLREKPAVLRFFASHPKAWFKFVVEAANDLEEVRAMVDRYNILPSRVYLMPEGIRPEELSGRQGWLIEQCKKYGFAFSDRLHVRIYGDRRGI